MKEGIWKWALKGFDKKTSVKQYDSLRVLRLIDGPNLFIRFGEYRENEYWSHSGESLVFPPE